tara:strand:+ start:3086 stop:3757 length:672 start_codon:yes stop_codon:yes gene_type:complete
MALTKVIGDGTGTLNSATVSGNATVGGTLGITGVTDSSVGQSFIPEFIGNLFLAGNTTDSCELTGCFTNTHQVYRLIGEVGASHAGESFTVFFFLSGTDTKLASGYYGRGISYDDASSSANSAEANGSNAKININQSSTGSSIIDMTFYRKQHAYQILGMAGYHDQSGDRGFQHFGYKNNSALELTGFRLENSSGNNMSAVNFSVYGYRLRQNATGEMLGAYQ